jgi:hypothetical protein
MDQLSQDIGHVKQLYHTTEIQIWTDCSHFNAKSKDIFIQIRGSKKLLQGLIGSNHKCTHKHRGTLSCVGEINKILFDTLGYDDTDYYDEQIRHFEENSEAVDSTSNHCTV